jgi:hypothetical protein
LVGLSRSRNKVIVTFGSTEKKNVKVRGEEERRKEGRHTAQAS